MTHTVFTGTHLYVIERDGWEFVERKKATEAVIVLARTSDEEVIFVEQHRKAIDARSIEWPAGLIDDPRLDAAATARNELEEETGFTCSRVEHVASGPSSPGITSEIIHFFRAHDVKRAGDGGGVEGEQITVHVVPERDVVRWLRAKEAEGLRIDAKLWAGLYLLTVA